MRGSKGAGKAGFQFPVKARDTIFSEIVQTGPGIHTASYLMGVGVLSSEQSGRGVKLAIYFYAQPRFRLSGTVFHSPSMPSCLGQRRAYVYPAYCYVYEPVPACFSDELLILRGRRRISFCSYAHGDGIQVGSRYDMIYRVIHKSLRDFRTRLRNNQDRHGRKEHINR